MQNKNAKNFNNDDVAKLHFVQILPIKPEVFWNYDAPKRLHKVIYKNRPHLTE